MKLNFKIQFLIALFLGILNFESAEAQTLPDPFVNSATVAIAPTMVGETANSISFQFMNVSPIGTLGLFPPTTITIQLSDMEVSGVFEPTNVTGPGAAYFSWTYNSSIKMITGTLTSAVAPLTGGLINITGFIITDSSGISSPQAGFNVNVNATGSNNVSTTNDFTSSYTYTSSTPLPIELLSFTARWNELNGVLNWATANEENSSHFDVERSLNGFDFEKIGTVKAAGNSSSKINYSFTDVDVYDKIEKQVYYRLRLADIDGQRSLSKTKKLEKVRIEDAYSLYPNPSTGTINFNKLNDIVSITLFTNIGQQISRTIVEDENQLEYHFNGLAVGVYQLVLQDENNKRFMFKLQIVK